MTDFEKSLLIEAVYWRFECLRLVGEDELSSMDLIFDVCDRVGLELEDEELDELVEDFENRV